MRDHVRCSDGPIAGRRIIVPDRPPAVIEVEAIVDAEQRVLAIENQHTPTTNRQPGEYVCVTFVYEAVIADDGQRSRADDGCLLLTYTGTRDTWDD